jgi:hypothetical protein
VPKFPVIPDMSADEFRAALAVVFPDHGQLHFARWLSQNDRAIRRWADGSARIPPSAAILLRLMAHEGFDPAYVRSFGLVPLINNDDHQPDDGQDEGRENDEEEEGQDGVGRSHD